MNYEIRTLYNMPFQNGYNRKFQEQNIMLTMTITQINDIKDQPTLHANLNVEVNVQENRKQLYLNTYI